MEIVHVPVDPVTQKVDVRAMARAITSSTCMLVGSAPQFPHGSIDDIRAIAELGRRHNIPVHVDACLGQIANLCKVGAQDPQKKYSYFTISFTFLGNNWHSPLCWAAGINFLEAKVYPTRLTSVNSKSKEIIFVIFLVLQPSQ